MEHQLHFKLVLSMSKEPENSPVYYKQDGDRFRNAKTIKLHTGVTYRLDFTLKPTQFVESCNIHGVFVPLEEQNKDLDAVPSSLTYCAYWNTEGIALTKKGEREHVPLVLKIKDKGTLRTSLQVKFYKKNDTHHCEWGNPFAHIEYECNANEHRNHVDIAKETFRRKPTVVSFTNSKDKNYSRWKHF